MDTSNGGILIAYRTLKVNRDVFMSIELLREFLGWCTVINVLILAVSTVSLTLFKEKIAAIHSNVFGVSVSDVKNHYFLYLAHYKIVVIVFNLAPYLALAVVNGG